MPISALNQQTTPAIRNTYPKYLDVTKTSKETVDETNKKVRQDTFEKTVTNETTYLNEVRNQINKNNTITTEKTALPKENLQQAQKITTGLYNPREITNQKNVTNEMTSQTKEMPKVRTNESIGT